MTHASTGATKPFLRNCWYVAAWSDELAPCQALGRLFETPVGYVVPGCPRELRRFS